MIHASPPRRLDSERRCTTFQFCGLAAGHDGDCAVLPEPGFQEAFLSCDADGAIASGTIGGGKSMALLLEAARWIEIPGYTALIVRKQKDDLLKPGGLWATAKALYAPFDGEPNETDLTIEFPSTASIQFGYVGKDFEKRYQGSQIGFLGIDELPHLTKAEFDYLRLRVRCAALTARGIRPYWRATCNPDPDSWVRRWIDWYIGADGWPVKDRVNQVRYYLARAGHITWGDSPEEVLAQHPRTPASRVKSFAFFDIDQIVRFLGDEYEAAIEEQDEQTALRWRGNWNARTPTGRAFRAEWFCLADGRIRPDRIVDAAPPGTTWCRTWDLAATAEADCDSETSHSFSAGPLVGLAPNGNLYVADLDLGRWSAGVVEEVVKDAAERDRARFGDVRIHFCREHAGAGKGELDRYVRALVGHDVGGEPETGDKGVRLRPLIAQAEHGHIFLVCSRPDLIERPGRVGRRAPDVSGDWHQVWIAHMGALTSDGKGKPNDVGDGMTAALRVLAGLGRLTTAEDMEAVIRENPILSGGETGGLATQPAPRGRFALGPLGPGRMRFGPPRGHQ